MENKLEKRLKTLTRGLEIAGNYLQYGFAQIVLGMDGYFNGFTSEWDTRVKKVDDAFSEYKQSLRQSH